MPRGKFLDKVQHNIDALRRQIFRVETKSYRQEIPSEVKESIKRFWTHFLSARGYLPSPVGYPVPAVVPVDVPKALAELQGALSELAYQKGYMSPQDYEYIKTHLEWSIDFLNKGAMHRAIAEMNELFSFLIEKAAQEKTYYQFPSEMQVSVLESSRVQIPAFPYELKNQFGNELKSMILEGEREGREVGAMLCRTSTGNLHLSRTCWGRRGAVMVSDCHDGLSPLGSFHVHLKGSDVFSPQDLEQAIEKEQLSCIGYMKAGVPMLKCVLPHKYYEYTPSTQAEIRGKVKELGNEVIGSIDSTLAREVQKELRNIEQLLSAYEIPL